MNRKIMLLASALVMDCTSEAKSQTVPQNATDASQSPLTLIRGGDFEMSNVQTVACPAGILSEPHPDIQFSIELGHAQHSLSAAPKDHSTGELLRVVATETGPASSHVELYAADPDASLNDEVWQVLRVCEDLEF